MIEIENKLNLISLKDTDSEDVKSIVVTKSMTIPAHSRIAIDSKIRIVQPEGLVAVADADNDEDENTYILYCDSNVDEELDDIIFTIFNLTDKELKLSKNMVIGKLYFYRVYDNIIPVVFEHNGVVVTDVNNIIDNVSTSISDTQKQIIINLK